MHKVAKIMTDIDYTNCHWNDVQAFDWLATILLLCIISPDVVQEKFSAHSVAMHWNVTIET